MLSLSLSPDPLSSPPMTAPFYSLSPALLSRIDRLSGCDGRWIVDCRELEGSYSYALRSLSEQWPYEQEDGHRYWHSLDGVPNLYKLSSPEDAAQYCAATRWRAKLLFSPALLDADCSWPGGYEASSLHRSNNRTFRDVFSKELLLADGDADGLSLDIRFITEEMLSEIESLENYPLLSEDDHSSLELELQEEAWTDWAERDFSRALEKRLSSALENDELSEEIVESLSPDSLYSLFSALSESASIYWQEESCYGQWINCERVAEELSEEELSSLAAPPAPGSLLQPIELLLASLGRT
jgi:hypothetical protein